MEDGRGKETDPGCALEMGPRALKGDHAVLTPRIPPRPLQPAPRCQVFDAAVVKRVDPALGLLLELPASPAPAPAFAHVSNLSDERVDKPEKAFRPGQAVRARVIGFRLVDGLALVSLKESVLKQQVRPGLAPRTGQAGAQAGRSAGLLGHELRALQAAGQAFPLSRAPCALRSPSPSKVYSIKDLAPGQPLQGTVLSVDPERGLVLQVKHGRALAHRHAPHMHSALPRPWPADVFGHL
jgi:hypothetical protein